MSNFCGIISRARNLKSGIPPPLSFERLAYILEDLEKETDEAVKDFERKSKFVAENDIKVSQNNELLVQLDAELKLLKTKENKVAQDILANAQDLQKLFSFIEKFGQSENLSLQFEKNERAMLLDLVTTMNTQMKSALADIEAIDQTLRNDHISLFEEDNRKTLFLVLNEHLEALLNTEKSLALLEQRYEGIEDTLVSLKQQHFASN